MQCNSKCTVLFLSVSNTDVGDSAIQSFFWIKDFTLKNISLHCFCATGSCMHITTVPSYLNYDNPKNLPKPLVV